MDYQTFNIFEFGKKKFSKTPFFDTEGNIMPFETQLAIVSHYLHLKGTKYEVTLSLRYKKPKTVLSCQQVGTGQEKRLLLR